MTGWSKNLRFGLAISLAVEPLWPANIRQVLFVCSHSGFHAQVWREVDLNHLEHDEGTGPDVAMDTNAPAITGDQLLPYNDVRAYMKTAMPWVDVGPRLFPISPNRAAREEAYFRPLKVKFHGQKPISRRPSIRFAGTLRKV